MLDVTQIQSEQKNFYQIPKPRLTSARIWVNLSPGDAIRELLNKW